MSTSRAVLSDLQDFARRCKLRRTPGVAPRTATLRWVVELLLALLSDDEGFSKSVVRRRVLSMLTEEYRRQQMGAALKRPGFSLLGGPRGPYGVLVVLPTLEPNNCQRQRVCQIPAEAPGRRRKTIASVLPFRGPNGDLEG